MDGIRPSYRREQQQHIEEPGDTEVALRKQSPLVVVVVVVMS